MQKNRNSAYTLIEVLVASGLLVIVLAGAAAMGLALVTQEEMNTRVARVQNYQEQLARLYQLGLDKDVCVSIAPSEPSLASSPTCEESDVAIDDPAMVVQRGVWKVVYRPNATTTPWSGGAWVGGNSSAARVRVIEAYRPSTR